MTWKLQLLDDKYLVLGWKWTEGGQVAWITSVIVPTGEAQPEFFSRKLTKEEFQALPWIELERMP